MSRSKFRRKRRVKDKQLDRRRTREQEQKDREAAERALAVAQEPEKEIWEIEGVQLPGSPGRSSGRVDSLMTDVRGNYVAVAERRLQVFNPAGGRKFEATIWRPLDVPELWSGDLHHQLTHALRLLQVFSGAYEGMPKGPAQLVLRGKIQPEELFYECGASRSVASMLAALLTENGLIQCRPLEAGGQPSWFVNRRTKGFGPHLEQYEIDDLPAMILPEFMTPPESAEPTTPSTEREDKMSTTAGEMTPEPLLWELYEWLDQQAENGDRSNGSVVFKTAGAPEALFAELKDLSPTFVRLKLLNRLRDELGVYESARGANPARTLRTDDEARQRVREAAGIDTLPAPPETEAGFRPNQGQVNELYRRVHQRLVEQRETIARLQGELQQEREAHALTEAQLNAARARIEELERTPALEESVLEGLREFVDLPE